MRTSKYTNFAWFYIILYTEIYVDDLIVFHTKRFIDYVKEIYPSELNGKTVNELADQASYLELTSIIGITDFKISHSQLRHVMYSLLSLISVCQSCWCQITCSLKEFFIRLPDAKAYGSSLQGTGF